MVFICIQLPALYTAIVYKFPIASHRVQGLILIQNEVATYKASGKLPSFSMSIPTTVVGSFRKPSYLNIPCWIGKDLRENKNFLQDFNDVRCKFGSAELEKQVVRATSEIIKLQEQIGISVVSDGEMRRDEYMYGYTRCLNGIDYVNLKETTMRNGAWKGKAPCIVGKITVKEKSDFLLPHEEWQIAQKCTNVPVKYTLAGPMTVKDSHINEFYESDKELCNDVAVCVNQAVRDLVSAGCKYIQIDDTVLVRKPDEALKFGIEALKKCFDGVPNDVTKILHMCCGYPTYLDQEDYEKADLDAYLRVAEALDEAGLDQISIEDTHRRNSLELFKKFQKTSIILGVIDVARSRIETVDEIKKHVNDVLSVFPREKLILAPDCGLVFLPEEIMKQKLSNMVAAARQV